jgi:hypothetical protein
MGGFNVYITKIMSDIFDSEYKMIYRINKKIFVSFINDYMKQYNKSFSYDKYIYNSDIITDLKIYLKDRYKINPDISIKGGYVEFKFKVFTHPKTKIIDIK